MYIPSFVLWALATIGILWFLIANANLLSYIWRIILIYVWCIPRDRYRVWYIKRHGWTPYWYKSECPKDNGKLYEHPDMWVHKDYKSTRYSNKDGAFPTWSAWMIAKGNKTENYV